MLKDSRLYTKNKPYVVFHWLVHFLVAHLLTYFSGFSISSFTVPFSAFGYYTDFHILNYFTVYLATVLFDLDHFKVLKRYGFKGIFMFAKKRIQYPFHNFFVGAVLSIASAILALAGIRALSVLLLAPVLHMVWDITEDVFVFKTSYRKWERTWGIGTEELENLWKEMEKLDKAGKAK